MANLSNDQVENLLRQPLETVHNIKIDATSATGFREKTDAEKKAMAKRLGYVKIPGQLNLSYSRNKGLHSCPRKFFIKEVLDYNPVLESNIHTAFGSSFGAGIQEYFKTESLEHSFIAAFASWTTDINTFDQRSNKSLGSCLLGLELFATHIYPEIKNQGYELAYMNGKPCIELFFLISIKGKYNYQGHVDIILFNKSNNKFVVLELKTTSGQTHEAKYKESTQALGYSVVLDSLAKEYNVSPSYEVEYLIYNPDHKLMAAETDWGFANFTFAKSLESKAEFTLSVMLDIQLIELYMSVKFFPKSGDACMNFNRVCEYYGVCDHIFTEHSEKDLTELIADNDASSAYETMSIDEVDYIVDMDNLLKDQDSNQNNLEGDVPEVVIGNTLRDLLKYDEEV